MARSRLGPLPDEAFEHDIPNIPNADAAYTQPFHDRMAVLSAKISRRTSKGEQVPEEILEDMDGPRQHTIDRMKDKGFSQAELDLAYGRTKK